MFIQSHKDADKILEKVMSWEEIRQAISPMSEEEKGRIFERLCQLYLKLEPTYNRALKNVWLLNQVPASIARKLRLPTEDIGIDIVAETQDNKFWAIQCKYRSDETHVLSYDELSTFFALTDTISRRFSFKLLMSSTERITRHLAGIDDFGLIAADVWRNLTPQFFERIPIRKRTKLERFQPFDHQKKAINKAYKHFIKQGKSRGKLISPCGSGKSLTAYWIARKLKSETILVAVPSLSLIKQTLGVWMREFMASNINANWICICSDKSAGQVEKDDFVLFTHDLAVPCSTDISYISSWFKNNKKGLKIVFSTYQSAEVLSKASRSANVSYDLAIFDEAHKTAGPRNKKFAHLLFDKNVRIKKRLFMTATERRYSGASDKIISMDENSIYGSTFEMLSFKEAIEANPPILSDYKIVTISVTDSEVEEVIKSGSYVNTSVGDFGDTTAAEFGSLVAFRKAARKYKFKHAISFHSSIRRAENFVRQNNEFSNVMPKFGRIECVHVSGKMPTSVRDRHLRIFVQAQKSLVTNARCLTEGVDIPDVDCVFFSDQMRSTVDIVQAAGRAMRISKGKKMGYIIVPIFLPATASEGAILEEEAFQDILTVLRALASNDERIIDYFQALTSGKRPSKKPPVIFDILTTDVDLQNFTKNVSLKIWSRLAKLAWMPFDQAREYVRNIGLKDREGWSNYCQSGEKPMDIPATPDKIYRLKGWNGWGDWLGTNRVATHQRTYRPFTKARAFVHKMKLVSNNDWLEYCRSGKKPDDIPNTPGHVYKNVGWLGVEDWLGTKLGGRIKKRSFSQARKFARKLKLKSRIEWENFCDNGKNPEDIPKSVESVYRKTGWSGWADFLGYDDPSKIKFRSYSRARTFVRKLKLISQGEWFEYSKTNRKPKDIPANPPTYYRHNGWISWGDWLGTDRVATHQRTYRLFTKARAFVRRLGLQSKADWVKYSKSADLPLDIPASPSRVYNEKGWTSWGDWLGTDRVANRNKKFLPYSKARTVVHKLGIKSQHDWVRHCRSKKIPSNIPLDPRDYYETSGWQGWGDWLGTGRVANQNRSFLPFNRARAFVRRLKLKNVNAWYEYSKSGERPDNIPAAPHRTYKGKGWDGWKDFLGKKV